MILSSHTKRTDVTLSTGYKLYSHSALSVTVEMKCAVYEGKAYHVTATKGDLLHLLAIIEERENEIKKELKK